MSIGNILELFQQAIFTVLEISAYAVLPAFVVGLLISIFQAMTQIQEQSLTFVPKILMVLGMIVLFGGTLITKLVVVFQSILNVITTL